MNRVAIENEAQFRGRAKGMIARRTPQVVVTFGLVTGAASH